MKNVVSQFKYAAVVERVAKPIERWAGYNADGSVKMRVVNHPGETLYDIWTWNVWKLKWTRMSQHGSGFDKLKYAVAGAKSENDKIETMLSSNKTPPEVLQ